MCIYGIIVGRRFAVNKASTVICALACMICLVGLAWIVLLSAAATDEINYQASMVARHGYIDTDQRPELDLNKKYGETWGIFSLWVTAGILFVISYGMRYWSGVRIRNFIRFRSWELRKVLDRFRPHTSPSILWRRKRYSNLF